VRVCGACPRRYEPLIKAPAWGPDKTLARCMKQVRGVEVCGACPHRYEPLIKAPAWGPDKTLARRMKQVRRVEHHMNWKIKVWSRSCDVRKFSFNFVNTNTGD